MTTTPAPGSAGAGSGAASPSPPGSRAAGTGATGRAGSDPAGLARDVCLRLLTVRPRTRAELEAALIRKGFAESLIAEVLDRYADVGMIDDDAFARAWVTSRHHSRGLAKRALAAELRRKGVPVAASDAALEELPEAAEEAAARELVERRLRVERQARRGAIPVRRGRPEASRGRLASGRTKRWGSSDVDIEDSNDTAQDDLDEASVEAASVAGRGREEMALARRLLGMLARKGYPPALAYRVVKEALVEDDRMAATADLLDVDECGN